MNMGFLIFHIPIKKLMENFELLSLNSQKKVASTYCENILKK